MITDWTERQKVTGWFCGEFSDWKRSQGDIYNVCKILVGLTNPAMLRKESMIFGCTCLLETSLLCPSSGHR